MTTKEIIDGFVAEIVQDSDVFLIRSTVSARNDIKIYLDSDLGLPINAISKINRSLYKKIEEAGLFTDGDFSLEVGSPGVDEPLLFLRQYQKHLGRNIELSFDDEQTLTGKLIEIADENIIIEELKDKKKKITENHEVPFSKIKKAIVQISF